MIKSIVRALAYMATMAVLFTSCTDDGDGGNSAAPGTFQVNFDGETYVADQVVAQVINGAINLSAIRGANQEFFILNLNTASTGTYQLGVSNTDYSMAYAESNGATGYVSQNPEDGTQITGEVTITNVDETNHLISGHFHFVGYTYIGEYLVHKEFTDGSFTNIEYVTEVITENNNTFSAKVDGVDYNPTSINATKTSFFGNTMLTIQSSGAGQTMTLGLVNDLGVGAHSVGGFGGSSATYINSTSNDNMGTGTINVTEHNTSTKHIIGTFNFTTSQLNGGSASYVITDGEFDVYYD